MTAERLKPSLPLPRCPRWPTMQWLLRATREELDKAVAASGRGGFPTTKGEIVCAAVLVCDPKSAAESIGSYRLRMAGVRPPVKRGVPLLLRIPSPISLRIDGLIEEYRKQGDRAFRYELVGGLIASSAKLKQDEIEAICQRFRTAQAKDAAITGRSLGEVLAQNSPRPGARRHLETVR